MGLETSIGAHSTIHEANWADVVVDDDESTLFVEDVAGWGGPAVHHLVDSGGGKGQYSIKRYRADEMKCNEWCLVFLCDGSKILVRMCAGNVGKPQRCDQGQGSSS